MKKNILTIAFLLISCIGANAQYFNPDKVFYKAGFESQEDFSKWSIESTPDLEEGVTLWETGSPWMSFSGIDKTSTQSLSFRLSQGQSYETSITSPTIPNNKSDLVAGFYINGQFYVADNIYGYFEISNDNGATWNILFDSNRDSGFDGPGEFINGWYYYHFNLPSEYNAKDIKLRFRMDGKEYNGFTCQFYIDGVFVSQKHDLDVALTSLEPSDGSKSGYTNAEEIKIVIQNKGINPISSCKVSYQIDNESPVEEEITEVIESGEAKNYTFKTKANLGEFNRSYEITAKVSLTDDSDPSNNEMISYGVTNVTTGIPYTPVFHEVRDYGTGIYAAFLKDEWTTDEIENDANWKQDGDIRNGALPYWTIQPSDAKEAVCSAVLRSRPIHLEKDKSYDLNFNAWSVPQYNKTNKLTIYVTKDRLGKEELTKIWENSSIDQTNAMNTSARFDISEEGNYYLAFHCTSEKEADELRMDGIYIINAPEVDAKLASILTPEPRKFMYTDSETVKVVLFNNGTSKAIEGGTLKINMSLNEGQTITETVTDAIGISEDKEYTFNAKLDLSEKSAVDVLRIWTTLNNDDNTKNDTLTQTLISNVISTPYTNNFNGTLEGEPIEMAFWEVKDGNQDGVTFVTKKSQWSSDYTFEYKPDFAQTTDEYLYSRPIRLKKDLKYKIQYRTVVSGENQEMGLQTILYKVSPDGSSKEEVSVLYDETVSGSNTLRQIAAIDEDAIYCIGFRITRAEAVDYTFSFSYLSVVEVVDYDIALNNVVMPGTYISAYNRLPIGLSVSNFGTETIKSVTVKVSSPSMEQAITEVIETTIESERSAILYFSNEITLAGKDSETLTFEVSIDEGDAVPNNNTQTVEINYLSDAKAPYSTRFKDSEGFLVIDKDKDSKRFVYSAGSGMLSDQYNFYSSSAKEKETDILISRSIEMNADKIYRLSFQYRLNSSSEGEIAPKMKVYAMNSSDASVTGIVSLVNSEEYNKVYTYTGYLTVPADGVYNICFATLTGYLDISLQGTFSIIESMVKPDLELVEFVAPTGNAIFGETEDVTVKIKTNTPNLNLGGIPFSCKVADKVYYTSYNATLNQINAENTVTFRNVNLNIPGAYELIVEADMQIDETPENNSITKIIESLPIIEVEVVSIDKLFSGKLTQETITATVRNNGKGDIKDVPISYIISHEGAEDVVVNEVIESILKEGESIQYSFTQIADMSVEGSYTIKVQVNALNDSKTDNDQKEITVTSSPKSIDVGVIEIANPKEGLLSKEETIRVKVQNFGEVDVHNIPVSATVTKGDDVIKELSTILLEVKAGETSEVTFTETVDMYMYGEYTISAKTLLENDDNTENDQFSDNVKAYKVDCGISEIIAPEGTYVEIGYHSITVVIENFGDVTVEDIPVRYKTGSMPISGRYEGAIAPKEKVTYTFPTQYRFQEKAYTLTAYTTYEGDMDAENDEISKELTGVSVGIENTPVVTLSIYPNPVKNTIHIESDITMQSITIYDSKGNMINTDSGVQTITYNLNVSHLSDGMYFLLIDTEKGQVVRKFIKE